MRFMRKRVFIFILASVLIAVLLFVWRGRRGGGEFFGNLLGVAPAASYKAVFLTNGTSFFGRIKKMDANFITLEDVFYLRTKTAPVQATAAASQNQLELVKLGDEIYGPEDVMLLNRRQILSVQDLKADSKVVAAIRNYYATLGSSPKPNPDSGRKNNKVEVKAP